MVICVGCPPVFSAIKWYSLLRGLAQHLFALLFPGFVITSHSFLKSQKLCSWVSSLSQIISIIIKPLLSLLGFTKYHSYFLTSLPQTQSPKVNKTKPLESGDCVLIGKMNAYIEKLKKKKDHNISKKEKKPDD